MIDIATVESFVFRYPLQTPVQMSYGKLHDRPMVLKHSRPSRAAFWSSGLTAP